MGGAHSRRLRARRFRRGSTISPRDAPELAKELRPEIRARATFKRRRGECRVPERTRSPCAMVVSTRWSPQVRPDSPGIPCAMVLTAYFVLSPATNSSCHRHWRIFRACDPGWARDASTNLTPATGARTTRLCRPRRRRSSCARRSLTGRPALRSPHAPDAARVHRIPPRVNDDHDTPSMGWDGDEMLLIWVEREGECFYGEGWTRQIGLKGFGKSGGSRRRHERRASAPLRIAACPVTVVTIKCAVSVIRNPGGDAVARRWGARVAVPSAGPNATSETKYCRDRRRVATKRATINGLNLSQS
jgi:hypothetical protein